LIDFKNDSIGSDLFEGGLSLSTLLIAHFTSIIWSCIILPS